MRQFIGRSMRGAAVAGMLVGLLATEAVPASTPEAVLAASDGKANDRFGYSLAASGDTLVVGAPGAKAAYVFRLIAGVWTEEAKLTGPNSIELGYSVAIDGDTIVVGDPGFTGYRGGAFVYRRTGVTWALEDWLLSPVFEAWDVFGDAVAVSGDTAMVGAPLQGTYDQGAVFTFARSGTTWTSVAGPANWTGYALGSSIALSGTRALCASVGWNRVDVVDRQGTAWAVTSTLVAGGGGHDTQDMGVAFDGDTAVVGGTNETYVFREIGAVWTEEARIPAASPVALDGDTIVLGGEDTALVFTRSGATWTRRAGLVATGAGGTERADGSVAVQGDEAFVGAPRRGSPGGAVLVFDLHFPDLTVAPSEVECGRTAIGFQSPARIVTLTNDGEGDLHVTSVSIEGGDTAEFSVAAGGSTPAPSMAPTVAPGASVTFAVTFAPQAPGPKSSALRVVSDDPIDTTFDVALQGEAAVCVASPSTGTVGTVVAVRGAGFGATKGKLLVLGGKKPLALKVTRWNVGDDGVVLGVITKALPAGDYHVCVAPRDAAQIVDPSVFAFAAPAIVSVSPASGRVKTEVVVTCTALGTTKGSVYLQAAGSTKRIKCTVTAWPRDAASGTGQGEARFRVPKKLAAGTAYDVVVVNKVGEGRAAGAFTAAQ
jgi:hypothetical protein